MDEALRILLTYGPGGVIAVLVVMGILIPKSFYDREVRRGDEATKAASLNAEALKTVSTALAAMSGEVAGLKTELKEVRGELKDLQDSMRPTSFRGGA